MYIKFMHFIYSLYYILNMFIINTFTILILIVLKLANAYIGDNICASGWTPYLEDKCYIALETVGTESEAEAKCLSLDPTATLVTIHTA